jgi:cell division protein FtsW
MRYHRHTKNFLGKWWWTVDRLTIIAVLIILSLSLIMVTTASPAVAERIGLESFFFLKRQVVFVFLSLIVLFVISQFSQEQIKILALAGFVVSLILLVSVFFVGDEIKGAKRWISIFGTSLQPSEFVKPFFAVIVGAILSKKHHIKGFPAFKISILLYFIVISLLILQPDFGMAVTTSVIFAGQLFLSGLSLIWIFGFVLIGIFGVIGAYIALPHVARRINNFLDPSTAENYQVKKSISAFTEGGIFGVGPGEGTVKQSLPDSHTDFIFSVIGEELGLVVAICLIALFCFIVVRGFYRVAEEESLFAAFATAGLLIQFGVQVIINIGVTLHLLPTKGMTLPFISYGGSSMLAVSVTVGMILALTKKKYSYRQNVQYLETH